MVLVGAGLTSATFAALNPDKKILVLEKDNIGGLCRTENISGIEVHLYGPHIFHTNHRAAWSFVNKYAEFNRYTHRAKSNVDGQVLPFPINLETYNRLYGVESPEQAKALIDDSDADNFEDYLIERMGHDLYDKYYKGYAEKMWGMPANIIPAFIAKRVPIRSSYNDLYFDDLYQGIPKEGYTVMIERMTEHCEIQNVDFLSDKDYYESLADTIIYTGSIDEYFDYEYGILPYRTLDIEITEEDTEDYQGISQMNYPDEDVDYVRIIEHKHFNPVKTDNTIISKERPKPWRRGSKLKRMYPIPLLENEMKYQDYTGIEHKAIFAGRLGTYTYMNMDQCILQAMKINETL